VPLLEKEGYQVSVIKQENKGLAAAINTGIKHFTGEFLTWPDPDDWLSPRAIETRVNLFREHPEVAVIRCNAELVKEDHPGPTQYFRPPSQNVQKLDGLFEDLLFTRTYFAPVCYMVRSERFLTVNPGRSIYVTKSASQNLQMLLPITQAYPALQLEEPLVFYCVRQDSRSHRAKTPEAKFARELLMLDVTRKTIQALPNPDPTLTRVVSVFYARGKLLPASFRGRMEDESLAWLARSDLGVLRERFGRLLVKLQCWHLTPRINSISRGLWSRILTALFWRTVCVSESLHFVQCPLAALPAESSRQLRETPITQGLVSIISPCYNVASLLPRLLDSLLTQTYKHLEVILVDDGSTDNTGEVIEGYAPLLKAAGYAVKVVGKPNGGIASAIDYGLKLFTGEFLTWPDADDWLTPNSIEEKVKVLRQYPNAGLVRCNAEKIDAKTGQSLGFLTTQSDRIFVAETLFTDLLHITTYFAPVCYMVRSSFFLEVNPSRSIYVNRAAMQNLQMMLPITHAYKAIQMDAPLAFYLVREGSLSRSARTPLDFFNWNSVMWEVTRQTLLRMENVDGAFIDETTRYFARNKLLPAAFKARLEAESLKLLNQSGLGFPQRGICKVLIRAHCASSSKTIDRTLVKVWARVLGRIFRMLVQEKAGVVHSRAR